MFTSGTTGTPKGVPVSFGNISAYLDFALRGWAVAPTDRTSQTFDRTFDLSVHDLFVTWSAGACLCVLPRREVMGPGRFIRDNRLTHWFSVPSVASFMARQHQLKPGSYPTLRCSLFCGEPLTAAAAELWQAAAPAAIVENLYGPTEATIAISCYRWTPQAAGECVNGIVPLGTLFDGQGGLVVDADLHPVPEGEPGELCLSGSHVTRGYLNAPEKTAEQYVMIGETAYYRTGDRVRLRNGCLLHLGRPDDQIQLRGHRVELLEIDEALRRAAGDGMAISVAYHLVAGRADAVVGLVAGCSRTPAQILDACRAILPPRVPGLSLADSTDLIGAGVYDSMGFVDALAELEARLGGEIDLSELSPETYTRVGGLVQAVSDAMGAMKNEA